MVIAKLAPMHPHPPTVVIENVSPLIECGRYPVKRAIGEDLTVEADVFKDGHDVVVALLKWRVAGAAIPSASGIFARASSM